MEKVCWLCGRNGNGDPLEIWKDIKGYEGYYQISNLGRVRSLDRTRIVKDSHGGWMQRTDKGKILKPKAWTKGKYLRVQFKRSTSNGSTRETFAVHRLVAEAFIEKPIGKDIVNHKDFDVQNNNANNLEWMTQKENVAYSASRMRHPKNSKLPSTGEKYIRKRKYSFEVGIGNKISKSFKTLEEAIQFRNEVMEDGR